MSKTGLISISFRPLSTDEIIAAAVQNGLDCIEWGSDVHVPAGDTKTALEVKSACDKAGIYTPTYGTYYRVGVSEPNEWDNILKCADILKSDKIRIWAYNKLPQDVSGDEYERVLDDIRRICDADSTKIVCMECHDGTLTDDFDFTLKLIRDAQRDNLKMYWQPNQYKSYEYNLNAARAIAPYCESVHVFAWEKYDRYSLSEHLSRWQEYVKIIRNVNPDVPFMLEFMPHDDINELPQEAEILHSLLD